MRYSRIDRRTLHDSKFRSLSDDGKLLFLSLLISPHLGPIPGLLPVPASTVGEELGWYRERYAKAYGELYAKQRMVEIDEKANLIWIRNAIHYNYPANHKIILGWKRHWDELPECKLKEIARENLRQAIDKYNPKFVAVFDTVCPRVDKRYAKQNRYGMPTQEQEKEQDTLPPYPPPPALEESSRAISFSKEGNQKQNQKPRVCPMPVEAGQECGKPLQPNQRYCDACQKLGKHLESKYGAGKGKAS